MTNRKKYDLAMLLCFAVCAVFMCLKAPHGLFTSDEAIYLAIPYRMMQGDRLIVHEWNSIQIYSMLIYPLYSLYIRLAGTMDGILLNFRFFYVIFQLLIGACIYFMLRKSSGAGAIAASVIYMLYSPFNLMTLSYNTVGIGMLTVCLLTAAYGKSVFSRIAVGLTFSAVILCNPYTAVFYCLYAACTFYFLVSKKKNMPDLFRWKSFLTVTAAAAAVGITVGLYMFRGLDLNTIKSNLWCILYDDVENTQEGLGQAMLRYFKLLFTHSRVSACVFSAAALLLLLYAADKKRAEHKNAYRIAAALLSVFYLACEMVTTAYINLLMVPMIIAGLFSYLLGDRKEKRLFLSLYLGGILYSMCMNLASNTQYFAISSGLSLTCTASMFFIMKDFAEMKKTEPGEKAAAAFCIVCFAAQLALMGACRCSQCFSDSPVREHDYTVESGIAKGLKTTEETAERNYYAILRDTEALRQSEGKNVVYFANSPWLYLLDEKRNGASSPWNSLSDPMFELKKIEDYWRANPDKVPEKMYLPKSCWALPMLLDGLKESFPVQTETELGYIVSR